MEVDSRLQCGVMETGLPKVAIQACVVLPTNPNINAIYRSDTNTKFDVRQREYELYRKLHAIDRHYSDARVSPSSLTALSQKRTVDTCPRTSQIKGQTPSSDAKKELQLVTRQEPSIE